jgi:hypothetical protein
MSRTSKRYAVYPSKKTVEVLGESIPTLNQAVECWAALLARAMARNAETFLDPSRLSHIAPCIEAKEGIDEWRLMAELLKEMHFEPEFPNPGELLHTAFEDANTLENLGKKWFSSSFEMESFTECLHRDVKMLSQKLRSLDYIHAWALISAVQWYWRHSEKIDFRKDRWWTLPFRREHLKSKNEQSQAQKRTTGAMARAEKRFAIYPAPRAAEVVGESLPAFNQAIECWAALVARATADNAKSFQEPEEDGDNEAFGEWSMLAEVLKGMRFEAEFMNPSELIASTVEDAHRLESAGNRFLPAHFQIWRNIRPENRQPEIDEHVRMLVEKLRDPKFDYSHAWALIVAVRWYWERADKIKPMRDRWWTLQFRRAEKNESSYIERKGGRPKQEGKDRKK